MTPLGTGSCHDARSSMTVQEGGIVRGEVLGVCAGVVVVALGMWIIWMFRGVFPIWILLLGLAFLIGRPVLDWLEWRIRTHERDRRDEE